MSDYDTTQWLYETFEEYRRGRAEVLNPEELYVTIAGWHNGYDKYVKFSGDSYELAEIQITGSYGGPARPFMYMLKEKLERNRGNFSRQIFNENIMYDRHQRGWIVDWDAISYELRNICLQYLMPEVSAELPPVSRKTQYKKNRYGYGGEPTLYASHQLVECLEVGVN